MHFSDVQELCGKCAGNVPEKCKTMYQNKNLQEICKKYFLHIFKKSLSENVQRICRKCAAPAWWGSSQYYPNSFPTYFLHISRTCSTDFLRISFIRKYEQDHVEAASSYFLCIDSKFPTYFLHISCICPAHFLHIYYIFMYALTFFISLAYFL